MRLLPLFLFVHYSICAPISNTTAPTTYDVIIVGAGITGLTAARHIQRTRPELSVLVLEGRGQVGGRVRYATMQTRNGVEFVDIGSQFISPTDSELLALIKELNVDTTAQLVCGSNSLLQQRKKRSINEQQALWSSTPFDDVLSKQDEFSNLTSTSISQLAQGLDTADGDAINRLMQTFFDAAGEQVSGIQLALTYSSQNATSIEILKRYGHGESVLAKGGMNEVVRRLADGTLIEYNQKVVSVNDTSNPVFIKTSNGARFNARQVILAIPASTVSNIQLTPQPEHPYQQLLENYGPSGHAYYFTMSFQRPTWRLNGKSGKVIYTSQNGPLVWLTTFDTTYAPGSCSNSTQDSSFLWGIAHFSYEVPFETRKRLYTQALMYSLKFADFSPLDISDVSFTNDELARATIPTLKVGVAYESLKYFNDFHTVYQNTHISSADFASTTLGTMNGAVHAGQTVASHVLSILAAADDAQANGILRDSPLETSTPFVYHTSSHYPPSIFEVNLMNETVVNNDDGTQNSSSFNYETTTHYPPTQAPQQTTTMKHFSFGNLETVNETIIEEVAVFYDSQTNQQQPNTSNSTEFQYHTSSIMPPIEPIETTTFIHFSNGNLGANSIQRDAVNMNVENAPNQVSTNGFQYLTTTHYPLGLPTNIIKATPSPSVVNELQKVSNNAQNSTSVELATRLNQLVHTILSGLRFS